MLLLICLSAFITVFLLTMAVVTAAAGPDEASDSDTIRTWGRLLALLGPVTIALGKLNRRLFSAGKPAQYREQIAGRLAFIDQAAATDADSFIVLQELSGLATFGLSLCLLPLLRDQGSISIVALVPFALAMFSVGPLLMYLSLGNRIVRKKQSILRAWPFALDLIAISVQAGMDIVRAVELFVSKRSRREPLTAELQRFLDELNLGKRRQDALLDLGKRLDAPSINSVIVDIVQAEQMGTPLAAVLKMESREYRSRRAQIAEKKALEAPVKMLFPLLFCIFPSVFVVLLGPLIIQFMSGAGK